MKDLIENGIWRTFLVSILTGLIISIFDLVPMFYNVRNL